MPQVEIEDRTLPAASTATTGEHDTDQPALPMDHVPLFPASQVAAHTRVARLCVTDRSANCCTARLC